LQVIEKCDYRVVSNGIKATQKFIQIRPVVLELKRANRQTEKSAHKVYSAHNSARRTPNKQNDSPLYGSRGSLHNKNDNERWPIYSISIYGDQNDMPPIKAFLVTRLIALSMDAIAAYKATE
jgi:hypothetical protein